MNIFRTLASGKQAFREEFISAFLAYLLSPKMDHGLGQIFLSALISNIAEHENNSELKELSGEFKDRLWEDIFAENNHHPIVELEFSFPPGGFIDIVIRAGRWFIMIENKINAASKTQDQIALQYQGLLQVLKKENLADNNRILLIYLVPASCNGDDWSILSGFNEELEKVNLRAGDAKKLVTWQPVTEEENPCVSIVSIIRKLLQLEASGMSAPISLEVRQTLLSLVDFAMGEFQGFHYEKATTKTVDLNKIKVPEILSLSGEYYIGIQYGRGGTVTSAWKNLDFLKREFTVSEIQHGWQYVPLEEFKTLARWALNPKQESLASITWYGKPFFTQNLYRVSKYGKAKLFIGIKGGISALKGMTSKQILSKKQWELGPSQKSNQWFSGEDFCKVLEEKGIQF